jgi:phytoene dehydrogenase-like protein
VVGIITCTLQRSITLILLSLLRPQPSRARARKTKAPFTTTTKTNLAAMRASSLLSSASARAAGRGADAMVAPSLTARTGARLQARSRLASITTSSGRRRARSLAATAQASAAAPQAPPDHDPAAASPQAGDRSHDTDVVVIGAGIGGLCCAALLARYGLRVTVVEAHYHAGGAAHSFSVRAPSSSSLYHFDAGPSFFMGLSQGQTNPLKQVLDAVGERVDCAQYSRWIVHPPCDEAEEKKTAPTQRSSDPFPCVADSAEYARQIERLAGPQALAQWRALEQKMQPLQRGAATFPAAALRADLGVLLTSLRFFGLDAALAGLVAGQLTGPFSDVVAAAGVTDPTLRALIDLECFVLSGMPAKDTLAAEMAFMFSERGRGIDRIDYPYGGSRSIVDALVRGVERGGGRVVLRAEVEEVLVEQGRAVGVALKPRAGGSDGRREVVRASKAVVSNASAWATRAMVRKHTQAAGAPASWREWHALADPDEASSSASSAKTKPLGSFMHLHLGIDATGLDLSSMDIHHLFIDQWGGSDAPRDLDLPHNVQIASIPSVLDPSLAPPGKAVVHAYSAANEPWELWQGVKRGTEEYERLKKERAEPLWRALERVIPDIRARAEVVLVGTPLTHARFVRRHRGSYGCAISAADVKAGKHPGWPGPQTPIPGLLVCGGDCAPGVGVPAAAASGMITASTLASIGQHLELLDELKRCAQREEEQLKKKEVAAGAAVGR